MCLFPCSFHFVLVRCVLVSLQCPFCCCSDLLNTSCVWVGVFCVRCTFCLTAVGIDIALLPLQICSHDVLFCCLVIPTNSCPFPHAALLSTPAPSRGKFLSTSPPPPPSAAQMSARARATMTVVPPWCALSMGTRERCGWPTPGTRGPS